MLRKLLRIRFIFLGAVFFTLVNSAIFLLVGIAHSIKGYIGFFKQLKGEEAGRPGIELLEGLDVFMISLVFLIFGLGILKIFTHYHKDEQNLPRWLQIENFSELKILLWETLLITLVVMNVTKLIAYNGEPKWDLLIYPAIIFILTASLFLVKSKNHK